MWVWASHGNRTLGSSRPMQRLNVINHPVKQSIRPDTYSHTGFVNSVCFQPPYLFHLRGSLQTLSDTERGCSSFCVTVMKMLTFAPRLLTLFLCTCAQRLQQREEKGFRAEWGWHRSLQEKLECHQTGPMMLSESTCHVQSDKPGDKRMIPTPLTQFDSGGELMSSSSVQQYIEWIHINVLH